MKDDRKSIIQLKEEYWATQEKLSSLERRFGKLGCRYRAEDNLCGHTRNTMEKYPGHTPIMPLCSQTVCPRK